MGKGIKIRMEGVSDYDIIRGAKKNKMDEEDYIITLLSGVINAIDNPSSRSSVHKHKNERPEVKYADMIYAHEKEAEVYVKKRRRGKRGGRKRKRRKHYNASYFNNP